MAVVRIQVHSGTRTWMRIIVRRYVGSVTFKELTLIAEGDANPRACEEAIAPRCTPHQGIVMYVSAVLAFEKTMLVCMLEELSPRQPDARKNQLICAFFLSNLILTCKCIQKEQNV